MERMLDTYSESGSGIERCENEALFIVTSTTTLKVAAGTSLQPLSDYFSHQVARSPNNLKNHIQRINLYIHAECNACVIGALQDLFIALGSNGRELRQRMLSHTRPFLDSAHLALFRDHLDDGMTPDSPEKLSNLSLLNRGHSGLIEMTTIGTDDPAGSDILDQAEESLTHGRIRHAINQLTDAIREEPWREDLHNTLLNIYRDHGSDDSFMPTFLFLSASNNPYLEQWQPLAARFSGEPS